MKKTLDLHEMDSLAAYRRSAGKDKYFQLNALPSRHPGEHRVGVGWDEDNRCCDI